MAQQIDIVANLLMKVDGAEAGINKLKSSLSKLKLPDGLDKNLTKSFANLDGIFERYRNQLNKGFKTKGDVSAFAKTGKELEAELDRVSKHMTELTGKKIDFKVNSEPIKQLQKDLTNLIEQQQKLSNQALNFKIEGSNGQSIQSLLEGIRKTAGDTKAGRAANSAIANLQMGDVASTKANIETIIASLGRLKQAKQDAEVVAGSGLNMAGAANAIKAQLDTATSGLQKVKTDADAAKASLEQMQGKQLADAGNQANKLAKDLLQVQSSMNQANKSAQDFANSSLRMTEQLNQLKSSTQYFFGLRNMINLLKRGFREALDTVKELDAAMTETAVVTKFDVGDMWEKLPEYTANANALGATIQDMYKSATLYYQQGLNQQQAMGIASETMKMARIGGLEAAEATDMMTAALRGFNMELSNTSAQRINDVYSNLAAKTASNTQELGEAMERTASIANSAGMSFEGTSAFLAQMIETTREAPENLGTAMKTIIARFQELKKNPLEMQEIDGEEVSFNKVDAALQTIGVSLKDTNGQFRELDQVFLDIASRWDGLSQTQQRYIATTAAGSRQQSRFIAMMNNYDRTVQLMSYANDSAGASNEQFGKTMESMEAKLNKLKNAWQLFTMGLASNDMLKGAVDGITKIVDGITKLIDKLSFGMGGLKSALTIFTAFAGLRMAGKGVNALLGGLGGMLDPNSSMLKGALGGGILGSRQGNAATQAKMINQPIVNVLNQILGAVRTGKTGATETGTRANYKQTLSDFRSSANKSNATISGTLGTLKGLDAQQVRLISKSNVGTMRQLQRSLAQSDMGNVLAAQTVTAMKRGNISGNQVAGLNKANIGAILGTQEAQTYSQNFIQTTGKEIQTKWPNTLQKSLSTAFLNAETSGEVSGAQATAIRKQMEINAKEGALATRGIINKYYKDESGVIQQNPLYNENVVKGMKQLSEEEAAAIKQSAALGDNILKQKTPLETFQNGLSHIGGAAISAGQGLMSLGATLNSMGFEAAGAAVSSFGSALSNLGMIANGIPAMLSLLSNPIGAIAAVVGVGIGAIALNASSTLKKIREDGEKVTDSFKQIQDETTLNITNLKTWKEEMATLSKGVDENGLNVNLSDVDYAHYLEIVDAVAKMNPEIVKGYTAQGHAIIENNKALEETLKKQQEIQKNATDTYIDDKALQKLINARNINQDFKKATTTEVAGRVTRAEFGPATTTQIKTAPLTTDVKNLTAQLKKQSGLDIESILKSYAINLTELENGEQQAINQFIKVQDKINSDVSKAVANKSEELNEDIINGFSNLSDNTAAFEEAIQPVLQNLQTYASTLPGFDNIGPEFQSAINSGLKDIVIQPDLNATQMQEQAQVLIQEFDNLTREGGEYATAMKKVEDAQDQFASSLDASEYAKNTEGALRTLNSLLKEYENNTSAYGQAVTEYLTNQITKIEKFTEEGTISLTEALNTATTEIAAAEGAYQAFQDATKTDMTTGAENMKSIFDEITKETDGVQLHLEGDGDNTLWTGLSSLFSEDAIDKAAEQGTNAVQNMLNRIKPMLQDGRKGFDAFWTDMFSDKHKADLDKIKGLTMDYENWEFKLDDDINPDVFHEMAEALGYSDEFLTSMLNKGRQFTNLNFMDMGDVRKALSTDTAAIKGTSTSSITNEQGKQETVTDIFVKGDYLKNALKDAGIINPKDQKEAIDNITKNGVKIIPGPKDINEDTFKHMGISDVSSLIKTFGDTGQFNRSEIEEYAQQMEGYNPSEFDSLYKDYLDSQEHPELPSINSIDSNVASIAHMIAQEHGIADQETKDAYKKDSDVVYGANGTRKGDPDSMGEFFALGLNKNGEKISAKEYEKTKEALEKLKDGEKAQQDYYTKQAKIAEKEGRVEDANWFNKAAKGAESKYNLIAEQLAQGAIAYQKAQEEAKKEKEETTIPGKPTETTEAEKTAQLEAETAKKDAEWQRQKQNYEEQAMNATGPTWTSLDEKANWLHTKDNYERQAQNIQEYNGQPLEKTLTSGEASILTNAITKKAIRVAQEGVTAITHGFEEGLDINPQKTRWSEIKKETQSNFGKFTTDLEKDLTTFDEKDAAFMLPAAQAFNKKVQDSYLKAYEKAAGEGTTVKDLNITPKVPQPTITQESPKESKVSPTIEQGANIVQQVAFEVTGQEEAQGAIDTIKDTADEGADLKVKAETDPSLVKTESKLDKIKGMAASGVTIKANASGIENIENQNPEINFSSNAKTIKPQVDTLKKAVNSVPTLKTVTISVRKTGVSSITVDGHTWSITTAAKGLNNKINISSLPTFGSLAKGTKSRYGQIGSKNNGGLTLTGEEGYEIAWLPNENRSMILGAKGPQMLDLPSDAVVWTHEQSKKILKQKAIPASSMVSGGGGGYKPSTTTSNSSTTIKRTNTSGTDKYIKNTSKKVEKAAEESAKSIKRVSVWWENIARQTEATQRKMDKNAKSFENYLKKTNITLKSAGSTGKGNDYIKNIGKYIGYNQAQVDRANKELAQLASGKWQSGKKKGKAATSKKTKKKKKNQIAYEQGADNIAQISYKKGKKEKTSYINLARFIKKDSTGAYVVSQKALNAVKGSDKRKAIADAANKEIDDRLSKKYKAEDAIEKAREALDKMGQDLYDTFFGWKNELTEIWRITQKIEQAEARAAQSKEYKSLLDAQLESGQKTAEEISAQRIKAYHNEIKQETELLLEKASSIKEKKQAVVDAYSLDDEVKTLNAVTAKLNKSKTAQKNITNAEKEVKNSKAQVSLLRNKLTNLLHYRSVKKVSTTKNGMENGAIYLERRGTGKQIAQTAKELAVAEEKLSAANKNLTNVKKANKSAILSETERTTYETYAKQLISDIKTQQLASKYTKLSQNADGTYNIDFDAEQLKKDKENAKITTPQYEKIKEYVEHIKETNDDLAETYKDITSSLTDMYSRVTTLDQEWADYAEQLWDISEKEESERIDELKTLSSSINDALKKLLDQIKKKLDERRKQEDNAKTERDISQKQQRLVMLQADTSGGHQVEIAQLQQEIADAQQNYQRSLEDQLLEKLQQQADEAAEQRERMIELEEQIKDATNNAALVDYWMGILSNPDSTAEQIASVKQVMYDTYMKINEADKKPQALIKPLEEKFNVLFDGLLHNREEKKEVENAIATLTEGENAPLTLIENSIKAISTFLEKKLPKFTPNANIKEETGKAIDEANDATNGGKKPTKNNTKQKQEYQSKIKAAQKNKKIGGKEFAEVQKKANAAGIHARTYMADLAKTSGLTWEQVIRAAEAKPNKFNKYRIVLSFNSDSFIKGYEKVHGKGSYKKDLKIAKDKKYKPYEYATGGLANYTGPAWLDGTPSKPELVLNAQDTKNFIALKDVLSKALGSTNSVENTYGNATYEININVDHLNNDYDVDKVVERVKKKIVQDSSYRNVTQVRNFR